MRTHAGITTFCIVSNPLGNKILAFAKRPVGVLVIAVLALAVVCCCGSAVLGGMLDGDPEPEPSASRSSAGPSTTPSPTPIAAAVIPTTVPAPAATTLKPSPASKPKSNCHPNYSVCLPKVRDLNCPQIDEEDFYVIGGRDPYKLDGDNDGIACESR